MLVRECSCCALHELHSDASEESELLLSVRGNNKEGFKAERDSRGQTEGK